MTKEERKEYMKAWNESHKEERKAYKKKYYQANKEQILTRSKAYMKAWHEEHKEQHNAACKAWHVEHREQVNEYKKAYQKTEVNSLGQTKNSIRCKSWQILKKMHLHIPGYETHHCFGYEDPSKFIYCSKELHLKIHQFLRDNNIDADSDHYDKIKHLLDDSVVKYGIV